MTVPWLDVIGSCTDVCEDGECLDAEGDGYEENVTVYLSRDYVREQEIGLDR